MKTAILWSGGVDSTYLIYKNLTEGNSVTAFYVEIENNDTKTKMELNAIETLSRLFCENFTDFTYKGVLFKGYMHLTAFSFQQLPFWLIGIIAGITQNIDEIQIGYVMNDDAISFLDDIKNVYNSFQPFIDHSLYNIPTLTFPLSKTKKETIINLLPEKYRNHTVFCEDPHEETLIPCGTCHSCIRRRNVTSNGLIVNYV